MGNKENNKWLNEQFEFIRGELRAIKALVGRNYGSSTEEKSKEEETDDEAATKEA